MAPKKRILDRSSPFGRLVTCFAAIRSWVYENKQTEMGPPDNGTAVNSHRRHRKGRAAAARLVRLVFQRGASGDKKEENLS
jgi:hypothetical protein